MLFSLEPASGCGLREDFLISPLPARKQLWEARDENLWLLEKSQDVGGPSVFGIMLNGQMAKLNGYSNLLSSDPVFIEAQLSAESCANWREWCSGIDGLGSLIMLATSLPVPAQ